MLKLKKRKPNRSRGGDMGSYLLLILVGIFMAIPLIYAIVTAFKPLDEIFLYPPRFYVSHPTFNNFQDLLNVMTNSWVPFSRYIFNTVLITFVGTLGHLIFASMAAYVLAKYDFPGGKVFFSICVTALLFNPWVTAIPNYLVMTRLGWVDTYLALIVPAFAMPMGLFLMKQFMEQIPDSLIEAARIDGAKQGRIFVRIVMPNVKPAWLTLTIFSVIALWNLTGTSYIYTEELKMLPYALQQILLGGVARAGASSAAIMLSMMVPITIFLFAESNVIETMASSGIKE
ncbi:MAG: carbohydrate ABC transporter permease [Lachnoclostridium sp.]|jgi:ABC-type glycerol-3-phosphate transport system permease component|nr:carbohydrate ABC transporter permease [Lachnoclostridium sp.]